MTRATHRSGRTLYVEMTFAVVTAPRGAVAVARDAAARVEKERAARR